MSCSRGEPLRAQPTHAAPATFTRRRHSRAPRSIGTLLCMNGHRIRRIATAAICTAAMLATPAATAAPSNETSTPADTRAEQQQWRGETVSVTPLGTMNAEEVTAYLREAELDTARVRHGVRAHRIVYRTVGPGGAPTTASHLLAVPLTDEHVLAQAMWMHGTTVHRGATASMTDEPPDRPTAFAIAAAGYAVTAPDYLGLGQSEDLHPYNHLPSTVSASLDALRASREVLRAQRIGLEREVMVTGHSQGAAATLAVGRALPAAHLRPGVLAPISGPYDVAGMLKSTMDGHISNGVAYTAYITIAWDRLHGLFNSPEEMFRAPYDRTVPPLFDGEHTAQEVMEALPPTPAELLTEQARQWMREPSGKLAHAIEQASGACQWPATATLYAAHGDDEVPMANAQRCRNVIREHGGRAEVVDVGDVNHQTSARLALPEVIAQFDEQRR